MTSPAIHWIRLHLPIPLDPLRVRAAVQAVAGLSGHPRVILETRGQAGRVSWWLGTDAPDISARVLAVLRPQLAAANGALRAEEADPAVTTPTSGIVIAATSVRMRGHRRVPLGVTELPVLEATTRGLLAALSNAGRNEIVVWQLVLGPRFAPRRVTRNSVAGDQSIASALLGTGSRPDARAYRDQTEKYASYGFGCALRIGVHATTTERAQRLISTTVGAIRGLEAPGVGIRRSHVSVAAVADRRSPWLWPLQLSVPEVAGLLGWPLGRDPEAVLPGVPPVHPKLLPPTAALPETGRVLGVATAHPGRSVAIRPDDALRHLHVIGPTGVGKSTLLARLALSDMDADHGLAVIDPKGDLIQDLLARVPTHRRDDVVVLDATDVSPVGINGLAAPLRDDGTPEPGWDPDLAADTVLSVFRGLYADSWGPRTHDILASCLLTLARRSARVPTEPGTSLAMVPLLLTNSGFRRSITAAIVMGDPLGLGAFWSWFENISEAERLQVTAPLLNKLRPILLRPGLRAVFGQRAPRFNLTDVFTPTSSGSGRILLVDLAKGTLGPEAARLLGSILVALLWQASLQRVAVPAAHRHPVFITVDEMQDYLALGSDLADALAQARGLGVGFTLAHQYLGQLPRGVKDAVLANARSRVTFQLTGQDAREFAARSNGQLTADDFTALPAFHAYADLLVDGAAGNLLSLATDPLDAPVTDPDLLRQRSRERYGRPLDHGEALPGGGVARRRPVHERLHLRYRIAAGVAAGQCNQRHGRVARWATRAFSVADTPRFTGSASSSRGGAAPAVGCPSSPVSGCALRARLARPGTPA